LKPLLARGFAGGLLLLSLAIGCGPVGSGSSTTQVARFRIELAPSPEPGASFDAVGLSDPQLEAIAKLDAAARAAMLQVFVAASGPDAPPMAGEAVVADRRLRFTPRYPLKPGVRYRAVLQMSRLPGGYRDAPDVTAEFELPPGEPQPKATVTHIYPTADTLPENQLKFYIHFSAPMSRGEAYGHVHLLDADGKEVDAPFLELGEELWDPDFRRFTLLFDPGRIKRGLKPREEVGPVLEEGKRYTLVVDADWHDATGQTLVGELRKSFDVGPPDNAPLDTALWKIDPPAAGARAGLVVRFPEPLDHSMLERVVEVADSSGRKIAGSIEVLDGETRWQFTPAEPWQAGEYRLVADATLEDLAGNSIGRAFDVDLFGPVQKTIETETVEIPFAVK
jgi:hypothetical protein